MSLDLMMPERGPLTMSSLARLIMPTVRLVS